MSERACERERNERGGGGGGERVRKMLPGKMKILKFNVDPHAPLPSQLYERWSNKQLPFLMMLAVCAKIYQFFFFSLFIFHYDITADGLICMRVNVNNGLMLFRYSLFILHLALPLVFFLFLLKWESFR